MNIKKRGSIGRVKEIGLFTIIVSLVANKTLNFVIKTQQVISNAIFKAKICSM